MLKNILYVCFSVFFIASCSASDLEKDITSRNENAFSSAKLGPNKKSMLDYSMQELVEMNFVLEHAYQEVAEQADSVNHFANSFLLSSAVAVALAEVGGASSTSVGQYITLVLGANEGFKYADPAQVARAYRKASREALCMAQTTVLKGASGNGSDELATGLVNKKDRISLVFAMRHSFANLRQRLTRPKVGFLNILKNIREKDDALEQEDKIVIEVKLAIANAEAANDDYSKRLLSCLQ